MPLRKNIVRKVLPKKIVSKTRRKPKKKTEKNWKWRMIFLVVIALVFSPFYYGKLIKTSVATHRWFRDLFVFDKYPHYEKFGIRIPRKYALHGIDVSSYQQKIDWKKVSAMENNGIRISFAFMKATEGVMLVDAYFQRNWRESKKAGIIRGAYHYFRPNKSGEWQAKFFLQTVNLSPGDLPTVLDIEETAGLTRDELIPNIQDFLDEVERVTKTKPIIYTNYQFYKENLKGEFDQYPIWIAHYYQSELDVDLKWNFWQHADNAHVDGIKGKVDMDVFGAEEEDLSKLLVQKVIR